ncbi:sugar ABC transporter substrate-binding protein [Gordoniibacillus kamchatkensis]|uniref:Sugar ABC transporter substrate-binding protein n=1 Tax=Gordoniibacillus kamchatkensis TaxID=1590651 RepID=A0ABR5ALQ9_9BACL|nr:sugar ABC transporter substrate-binding protein [Paenibacillus sp. VKM B-2647]KIL41959.1 sugar ABC transporter substrate-binding protein [Paenibacillus sp. VKM B-2647]
MKKWISLAAIAGLVLAMAACSSSTGASGGSGGNGGSGGGGGGSGGDKQEKVTITYGLWDQNQVPAMQEIANKFQEANPSITVKIEVTPWDQYWTKLETAATGGTLPDVFWMNGVNIIKYASNKMLTPLSDKVKSGNISLDNYPKSLVDLYSYNGTLYGMPKDFDTVGLWYNKKMFDAAGLKYPDETWDWSKLRDAATKLTDPAKGVWGMASALAASEQTTYYNTIFQAGGYVISPDKKSSGYDKPEAIEGMKFWSDLIKDKLSPTVAQMTETAPRNLFESGKVAMLTDGSWAQIEFSKNEYTKDKVDVTVLPQGKKRATVIHGLGNVIAANSKHQKEAWEFVKFLGSKDAADIQAKTGTTIPAYNGTQDAWVKSNPNFHLQIFIDELQYSVPYPVSKDAPKWQEVEKSTFNKGLSGEIPMEEAAKQVAAKMNELLKQEK